MGGFDFTNLFAQNQLFPNSNASSPAIDLSQPTYNFDYSYGLDDGNDRNSADTGIPDFWHSSDIETPALDRYMSLVQSAPKIADYHPSFWRGMAAGAVSGLSGHPDINDIRGLMYAPYTQALADYKTEEEGARQAANIEQANIRSGTGFASALGRNAQQIRANELRKQQIDNQYQVAIRNARTSEERARIDKWYKEQQVSMGKTRLDQGERRLGFEGARVQQGWDRIEQGDKALGYTARNTRANEERTAYQTDPNRQRGRTTPRQIQDAQNNAMTEILLDHPEFEDLVRRDERSRNVIGWNPDETSRSRNAKALAELRRLLQEKMNGGGGQQQPAMPQFNMFDPANMFNPSLDAGDDIGNEDEDYNFWENDF